MQCVEQKTVGYIDGLFGITVDQKVRHAATFPVRSLKHDGIPVMDDAYVFTKDHLKILKVWFTGNERNLMLTGETGAGKTSLVEQSCARLGWPVFRVGCHGGLEFQELIGRVTLMPDGSTGWADGPVIAAMRCGGVLLLDEGNFLRQEVVGGLNTILDHAPYYIAETGETVRAHPDFRIALTGNAINGAGKSKYKGVNTPNLALLDRFMLGINVKYLSQDDEIKLLASKAVGADEKVLISLVELAGGIRNTFESGEIGVTLSTRMLLAIAKRIKAYGKTLEQQSIGIANALEMSILYRCDPVDAVNIKQSAKSIFQRNGVEITMM